MELLFKTCCIPSQGLSLGQSFYFSGPGDFYNWLNTTVLPVSLQLAFIRCSLQAAPSEFSFNS